MKKRLKLIVFLIFISQAGFSQNTVVDIFITGDSLTSISLMNMDQSILVDKSYTHSVSIAYSAKFPDNYRIDLKTNARIYSTSLWLDTGRISIFGKLVNSKIQIDSVRNSKTFDLEMAFWAGYNKLITVEEKGNFLMKTIEANLNNPFTVIAAGNYLLVHQNNKAKVLLLKSLLAKSSPLLKTHFLYEGLENRVESLLATKLDISKYTFLNTENKNEKIVLSGRNYLLLDFWFTECKPCIEDHQKIKAQLLFLAERNTELISLSIDQDYYKWTSYLRNKAIGWQNYRLDPKKSHANITADLGVDAFPRYILFNQQGEILFNAISFDEIKIYLSK